MLDYQGLTTQKFFVERFDKQSFLSYCLSMITITTEELGIEVEKVKRLRHHQAQLHYFLDLFYNKEKYSDSERAYYKKFSGNTYRKHLAMTAQLQEELNQFDSEAIF